MQMTADECNERASNCAISAAEANTHALAQEFMHLAARWRAMAVRQIDLRLPDEPRSFSPAPLLAARPAGGEAVDPNIWDPPQLT